MNNASNNERQETRRLAAIMFTDMVGYSALTQSNESLAISLLDEHKIILRNIFSKYFGNEISTMGDGFFIEFNSALEACLCAIEIQERLFKRNLDQPEEKKIKIRIGIHLGDVIFKNNNLFGDGVNIAARLEPIAEPGGICVSEDIYRQIRNKINFPVKKLAKKNLKNINTSVDVFKIELPWLSKTAEEPEIISHYKIIEKIGEGGMGVIYKAEDLNLNRTVSLKFLSKHLGSSAEAKRQFIDEAKTASSLDHPNICNIYEINETDEGQLFISMSLYDSETLEEKINNAKLSLEQKIEYSAQILNGLAKAHEKGIVHGDIKPSNIVITNDNVVKIIDFGVAKLKFPGNVTKLKVSKGTLDYLSPEQLNGKEPDQSSDIWAFGVLLYKMFYNEFPFKGGDEKELINSIYNDDPQINKGKKIPQRIKNIVNNSLEKNPAKRKSSWELLNELEDLRLSISNKIKSSKIKNLSLTAKLVLSSVILMLLVIAGYTAVNFFNKDQERKYIAVIPFKNVGDDPANQIFCDGLVETLNSQLTQIGDLQKSLWVVPASEVRKNEITSPSEALRDFGVSLAVTGSIQRSIDKIRLAVNIVDTKTRRQISSMIQDYTLTNLTDLQDQAVREISRMLEIELHPETIKNINRNKTLNSDAYLFFIQGKGYLQRYWEKENIDFAISLFNRSVKQDSSYALAYSALGEAYWRKYELTKDQLLIKPAFENCNHALELNDDLASTHYTLGIINKGTGKYTEAVNDFQKSLDIDPINSDAMRELALTYEELNNFKQAEDTYKKAIGLKPDYWAGYNYLGAFYFSQQRYEDALKQFEKVVELTPDNYRGYNNLGGTFIILKKWKDAQNIFEKSLNIKPNAIAYSNLASIYFSFDKNYSNAINMYKKALEFRNNDYRLWTNLALSYRRSPGRKLESVRAYQKAAELAEAEREVNPNDEILLSRLAGIYSVLGDSIKAIPLIEKSIKLAPDNSNILALSVEIYEQLGLRTKAITNLKSALSKGYNIVDIKNNPELKNLVKNKIFEKIESNFKK